ncbi:MAG: oxidase [Alphaproteobacteria bacterium RIFCSPLOWO2_01_FULL_45_8]|nr:MAG: oxidase [Alphaproteobacteria bacterium GWB1_45_5]OFW76423.1 MAG: oxidase [Alphaproteobacteria bacterium GWA1_45_9]OFW90092.1 MAG: oxidase [Alphaproteobacteria bacterium RIFCSPHIGHO2_01_FULL_41_14]OFW95864.1 MAG: oxidase [Alphaproteobacteria bacterium RIFCSPLOWO2_01_FULL_45_8]HCI48706.1 oxidase [Holosporales bacterium]
MIPHYALDHHHRPLTFGEKIVHGLAVFLRILADLFFRERYGHRAVFIETIAAIPGMVGGALLHFRCLRKIKEDEGWIRRLLEEAENERMHLMAFIHIAKPTWLERVLIYMVQFLFIGSYFLLYVLSSRLAHRFVGYLEEEAIHSYSQYLKKVLIGAIENSPAPTFGIQYWNLKKNARLSDLIISIREDERTHRDVNHYFSDILKKQ